MVNESQSIILHVVREKETFTENTKERCYYGKREILPDDENDGS